jgi:hypothetical protein
VRTLQSKDQIYTELSGSQEKVAELQAQVAAKLAEVDSLKGTFACEAYVCKYMSMYVYMYMHVSAGYQYILFVSA